MQRSDVLIENPPPGGGNKTNVNRARRYVKQGRAVWVGEGERIIRFGKFMRRVVAASADRTLAKLTGREYDSLRGQWFEHARHIPIIHPEKMI